jgi:hypothetical protein
VGGLLNRGAMGDTLNGYRDGVNGLSQELVGGADPDEAEDSGLLGVTT